MLKGPGTLFIKKSKKVNKIYEENNEQIFDEYKKLSEKTSNEFNEVIDNKYQKILANKLKDIKSNQLKSNQGLIFLVGKNNLGYSLLHSEPKIDTPRIFISILPGSKSEILELQKRWNG